LTDEESDHNHPQGANNAPPQLMCRSALLPVLPVNSAMPDQAWPLTTPHLALHFNGHMQPMPAWSVTYADSHPANVRHIAPTSDKDNVYNGIVQTVQLALVETRIK
jgi:hypothetical protein